MQRSDNAHRAAAAVRVAFGLVWAIDAGLKWLPGFRSTFGAMLDASAQGQPGWLRPWFDVWTGLPHGEAVALAYGSAAMETLIAAAVIIGFARKTTYIVGLGYSLLVWSTGEGFGGPYHAGSTDIGTSIIYSLVFATLLVVTANSGSDPYSVDRYLEGWVSWWSRVAEVGASQPAHPPLLALVPVASRPEDARRGVVRSSTPIPISVNILDDDWPA